MADKAQGAEQAPPAKKKLPIKTLIVVLVVMVVEAVAVVLLLGGGGPQESQAADANLVPDEGEQIKEILLVEDRFQNYTSGVRPWIWDVAVYAQVKQKNAAIVEQTLEHRKAEVAETVGRIISRAQSAQLKEPDRQTLIRQITAELARIFEPDAEGNSRIERVLIPKCRGTPANY